MSRTLARSALILGIAAAPVSAQRTPIKPLPQPVEAAAKPFAYPAYTIDSLPNGLRFAVVENHELPIVIIRTAFRGTAGPIGVSYIDPPEKPGAWALLLAMLREGTTTRSSTAITDELAELGTEIIATAPTSGTPPALRSVRSAWKPSLDLVADMFINATVPEASLSAQLPSLAGTLERLPGVSLNNRILYGAIYGDSSPVARFSSGASIRAMKRDDLMTLKDRYLRPQNTIIVVAGDITVAEARAAMAKSFGAWERGGVTIEPIVPAPRSPQPTTIYLRDAPGASLASISIGQLVPGRGDDDSAAIETLSAVLGDFTFGAGSRVYNAIRVQRGLAYAVGVQLAARPIPEPVMLSAQLATPPVSADSAITVLMQVFRELRGDKPPTAEELLFSKQALVGRQPMDLERIEIVAASVLASMRDRLPPEYLNSYPGRINGVTLPLVQAAARKYLDPDHMVISIVGDRSKLEGPVRALGYPVVIVP